MVGVNVAFSSTKKSGNQPYGVSFAFNNANEMPMPLDNRTNDLTAGLEWAKRQDGMVRLGWDGSWFDNQFRIAHLGQPAARHGLQQRQGAAAGPYDASGYSNGNGPAQGRMAMPPSNSMNSSARRGCTRCRRARQITRHGLVHAMKQNDALIPWTINSAIANPAVYALLPGLRRCPRRPPKRKVHGLNACSTSASRPNQYFGFDMRYRFNDHENLDADFRRIEDNVRFDAVPEETGGETEHFNIRQNTFD